MGTGKSTVSGCLHSRYGLERLEMDDKISEREGMSIPDIFREKGEAYFRELETKLLIDLSARQDLVVSCGGGTAMRRENVDLMKESGTIVLLGADPQTVYERVKGNHNRPLLEGNMNPEYIENLMEARRPAYEAAADITVKTDGKSAEAICMEIMEHFQ